MFGLVQPGTDHPASGFVALPANICASAALIYQPDASAGVCKAVKGPFSSRQADKITALLAGVRPRSVGEIKIIAKYQPQLRQDAHPTVRGTKYSPRGPTLYVDQNPAKPGYMDRWPETRSRLSTARRKKSETFFQNAFDTKPAHPYIPVPRRRAVRHEKPARRLKQQGFWFYRAL